MVTVVLNVVATSIPSFCHFWNKFPPAVAGAVNDTTVLLL